MQPGLLPEPVGEHLVVLPGVLAAVQPAHAGLVQQVRGRVGVGPDPTGGSPGTYTSYSYSGAAWHYDDNELVQPKYRTYGQWRGYHDVKTYTGTGADAKTESETSYYQGMSDDNNSDRRHADRLPGRPARRHQPARRQPAGIHRLQLRRRPGRPLRHRLVLGVGRSGHPQPLRAARAHRQRHRRGGGVDPAGDHRQRQHHLAQDRNRHQLRRQPLRHRLRPAAVHLQPRRPAASRPSRPAPPPPTRPPTRPRTWSACPPRSRRTRLPAAGRTRTAPAPPAPVRSTR